MAEVTEVEKIILTEPVKPEAKALPTRDEVRESGWSENEISIAEKNGMLKTEKKEEAKPAEPEKKPDEKPPEKEITEEKPAEVKKSSLPDFEIHDPAKEKVFLETFGAGTPQRAMYFRMKNERLARQNAETERNIERKKREDLEARLAAFEQINNIVKDENGNEIPEEDRPLTLRQLREIGQKEREEKAKQEEENLQRHTVISQAQKEQEDYARTVYPDFDESARLAAEIVTGNFAIIEDKVKRDKAMKLFRDLQAVSARADEFDFDGYNGAIIAYELGQLHPKFGKNGNEPTSTGSPKDPKANGSLKPDNTMKRIEENNLRRASSASVPGSGGQRVVSADDVTLSDLSKMTSLERLKFRESHPGRYAKLMRG